MLQKREASYATLVMLTVWLWLVVPIVVLALVLDCGSWLVLFLALGFALVLFLVPATVIAHKYEAL